MVAGIYGILQQLQIAYCYSNGITASWQWGQRTWDCCRN